MSRKIPIIQRSADGKFQIPNQKPKEKQETFDEFDDMVWAQLTVS